MTYKEVFTTRRDIESKLQKIGDYVKIDFLMQCLKKGLDFETKRFVMIKLAEVYEIKKMFLEAGKIIRQAADINTTFEGKIKDFIKSMKLFIMVGAFDEANISYTKALASANESQKIEIKSVRKKCVRAYADDNLKKDRRRQAMESYEILLTLESNPIEKQEIQKKLLSLYEKLGKIKEYSTLKQNMNSKKEEISEPQEKSVKPDKKINSRTDDSLDNILSSL